ncbi:MAG: cytochrome c oxidase subunit II [Planctomycetota bacterium]|nr:cytochrome c oxidase subunit II [Planctomycetota bacterium]
MRALTALLFVALVAGVVWSFAVAPERGWWMPTSASSVGDDVDRLFHGITALIAVAFVGVVGWLAWLVWRGTRATNERALTNHGNARLEGVWTIVTGAILLTLAIVQLALWNTMQSARASDVKPLARVVAAQFEWRFRYPGVDAVFDTADDFETPYRLVVPVGERVTLELRSKDVIHGFFVPAFRLKQDVLPGSALRTWFEARSIGEYDVVCSQLCGAGHYRMAGKIQVVARADFDAWQSSMQLAWNSNGKEKP